MKSRHVQLPPKRRGPDGERLCRWCGKPVPKPRREWCSDTCVDEYGIRANPTVARSMTHRRDKGVCVQCGFDSDRLEKIKQRAKWGWVNVPDWRTMRHRRDWSGVCGLLARLGRPVPRHRDTYWDMDHIVPVAQGGGGCGLDNLQTLCLWCHQRKTSAMNRRAEVNDTKTGQIGLFGGAS